MQNRELFRWTFAASGLWLIISPFLLFGEQSALSNAVMGDAGVFMVFGLLALIFAGYSFGKHRLLRFYLGLVLGLVLIAAPLAFEFTEKIATWDAGIVGVIMVLVSFYETYQDLSGHSVV